MDANQCGFPDSLGSGKAAFSSRSQRRPDQPSASFPSVSYNIVHNTMNVGTLSNSPVQQGGIHSTQNQTIAYSAQDIWDLERIVKDVTSHLDELRLDDAQKRKAEAQLATTITSLSPTSGLVGTSVTITGTNFGSSQGSSTVNFNGTAATTASWSATSITATVPTDATTGDVIVTVGGVASNGVIFTITSGITMVRHAATDTGTANTTSVVVTLNGVSSGDLLTCSLTYGNPGGTTLAVSDNLNGAWSVATTVHFSTGISQTTGQFYFANSKAGNITITGTPGAAGEYGAMDCQEWSGVATSNPLDQQTQQDGTTANPSSGSVTTTTSGELILGDLENGYSPSAGSGFTLIDTDTSPGTGSD
jgi:IPT/TIG domain